MENLKYNDKTQVSQQTRIDKWKIGKWNKLKYSRAEKNKKKNIEQNNKNKSTSITSINYVEQFSSRDQTGFIASVTNKTTQTINGNFSFIQHTECQIKARKNQNKLQFIS